MSIAFREKIGRFLGRRPPMMQVAALCLEECSGKVLLVTSRGTGRWIVPKGWPMPGISLADAALQEAWEEAGVRGQVDQSEIGRYRYSKEQDRGYAVPVEVLVFPVKVRDLEKKFPEVDQRKRRWFTPHEAANMVAEAELKQLLRALPDPRPA